MSLSLCCKKLSKETLRKIKGHIGISWEDGIAFTAGKSYTNNLNMVVGGDGYFRPGGGTGLAILGGVMTLLSGGAAELPVSYALTAITL